MLPTELFDELIAQYELPSDGELARRLGITSARISQLRTKNAVNGAE
jgi:DNA-binding Xre family transcriptional regulator